MKDFKPTTVEEKELAVAVLEGKVDLTPENREKVEDILIRYAREDMVRVAFESIQDWTAELQEKMSRILVLGPSFTEAQERFRLFLETMEECCVWAGQGNFAVTEGGQEKSMEVFRGIWADYHKTMEADISKALEPFRAMKMKKEANG